MKTRTTPAALIAAALALAGCSGTEELSYGEPAKKDNLEVAVLRVEAGTPADLSALEDAAQYADRTPYYVHYRVTKTEAGEVTGPSFDVMSDGGLLTRLNIMSGFPEPTVDADGQLTYQEPPTFDKCLDEHDSAEFKAAPAGESYEGCSVYLSQPGSTEQPEKVEWVKSGMVRSSDDEAFAVWK
ncbi:hypothetical protein [Streptomyces sp. NPDC000983]|uniref:hypothetical protein n=1 Tax=Streptomyces sp. NPDC000983 TaxID=3154373 RepID=UPI00332E8922